MKEKKRLYIKLVSPILLFTFLYGLWIFFHELAHYSVCKSLGYDSTTTITINTARVVCPEIGKSGIFWNLLYLMVPYIIAFIVFIALFWMLYKTKINSKYRFLRLVPYVIAIDVGANFFGSLLRETDFYAIKLFNGVWFYIILVLCMIMVGVILYYTYLLAIKDKESISCWFENLKSGIKRLKK